MKSIEGIKYNIKRIEDNKDSSIQVLQFNSEQEREEYKKNHPHTKDNKILVVFTELDRLLL